MSDEKFDFAWNDFESNAINTIRNLLNDTEFTDVTFISDDRKRIETHKIILSLCSLFFKQILAETSTEKPLLFIKGIEHSELSAIVKFIYLGRTEIAEDDLGKFMKAAKELQIDGLQEKGNTEENVDTVENYPQINTSYSRDHAAPFIQEETFYEKEIKVENIQDDNTLYNEANDASSVVAFQNLDFEKQDDGTYSCGKCKYQTRYKGDLKRHIHSKHEGKKYPCGECDIEYSYRHNLSKHRAKTHNA